MTAITENQVVQACQTLFGNDVNISRDFLYHSMQPSGVKSAYRKKAKETHPDFFAADPLHIQQKQTLLFREILGAYDILNRFFKQRDQAGRSFSPRPSWKPRQKSPDGRHTPSSETATRQKDRTHYHGNIPQRTLQIGQYLYYRGKISFVNLINALMWQRKQRPSFGDIAVRWGWLDTEGLTRIFKTHEISSRFGEKAVALGLLKVFEVNTILLYQRSRQNRLGLFFVQNKLLSPFELEQLVRELNEHNAQVLVNARQAGRKQRVYV